MSVYVEGRLATQTSRPRLVRALSKKRFSAQEPFVTSVAVLH